MAIIDAKGNASSELLKELESANPEYWEVYELVGKYYYEKGYDAAALIEFKKALTKEITTVPDRVRIEKYIKKVN